MKKKIVISGINITHGGPLSVFEDILSYLSENLSEKYDIYALTAEKGLLSIPKINYLSYPKSKITYLHKLYYEYFYFNKLSNELKPFLWFSISNITPSVKADVLVSYLHNAAIFGKFNLRDAVFEPKLVFIFKYTYKFFFRVNCKNIDYMVVQADWLRKKIRRIISVKNIIVAYPIRNITEHSLHQQHSETIKRFFFPAFPRVFKNFEIITKATEILNSKNVKNFEVYLTLDRKTSKYSKMIFDKYKKNKNIFFTGILTRNEVYKYYKKVDCLIFPSKLETWGLPISEFKDFNKPILAADLEYARETVGNYNKAKFFNPENSENLAKLMHEFIEDRIEYEQVKNFSIEEPFIINWDQLFKLILNCH